jgi:hypothetical protein
MPRPSSRSAAIASCEARVPSFFPAIAAYRVRRYGSHHSRNFRCNLHIVVMVVLFAASGIANAQPIAAAQSAVPPTNDPLGPFVAEAAQRFDIPASWIRAVMQTESRGTVHAVSPKGAMGLMQIMPQTWADLRSRYGLGANPFDPHDNILAGAAYLRELRDRYGAVGFLAAYNAGPGRYEDHLASGHPLPLETQTYVAALTLLLAGDGSTPGSSSIAAALSWTSSPLFPVHANDVSSARSRVFGGADKSWSISRPAADWTGLAPQAVRLFARLSTRKPKL